ncbi:deoxycytidylate deaminase [Sporosarcina ureilytica]|uniref:deoxycytidylate deaminase n=1 Tax=Sporosarcina ureilytica TaxID=298596 RepID=UPI0009E1980D|nr:deaminase [Sporosarcina ureilytica]
MITAKDLSYMAMAEKISKKATCNLLNVGCVIVNNNIVVSTGWNAAVKGYKPCDEVGHVMSNDGRCVRQVHAETNAILATNDIDDLQGATVYVTLEPCDNCTKLLNQCGIKKVIYKKRFKNPFNMHFIEPMEWICLEDIDS